MKRPPRSLILLFVILAVGLVLRTYRLTEPSLWFDEAASFALVDRFTWTEMLTRIKTDVHPPLFYSLFRLWTETFGDSVAALRGFSVLFGAFTLVGVYLFCRDGFGQRTERGLTATSESRRVAIVAAALVALSPAHIEWSQTARMYGLGTALAALSGWMLLRALYARRPLRWWTGYGLVATAFLYTHYYALFTIAAQGLAVVCYLGHQFRRNDAGDLGERLPFWTRAVYAGVAFLGAAAAFLPWLPVLRNQLSEVRADFWIGPAGLWSVPNAWFRLFVPCNCTEPPPLAASLTLAVTLVAVLGAFARNRRPANWLVVWSAALPATVAAVFSATTASIVLSRYFLFAHLFASIGIALVVGRDDVAGQWRRPRRIAVALVVLASTVILARYESSLAVSERPGVKAAVSYILENRRGDAPIVVLHPAILFSVQYYAPDADVRLFYPTGAIKHYYGAAMLTPEDFIPPAKLPKEDGDEIWGLGTSGYTRGFDASALPDEWKAVPESRKWFREVHAFQGAVVAGAYRREASQPRTDE